MFTKIGGKAYGYATLLAVFFSLAACGPGPGTEDGGTDGSVDGGKTDGGEHPASTVVIQDLQSANVKDTTADVQGTLLGLFPGITIKTTTIEVVCTNNRGWTTKKEVSSYEMVARADNRELGTWSVHFDGLVDETDYDVGATAIETSGARGVTQKITFHTHKPVVEDPLYVELVRQMLPGKVVLVPPTGHENDPNWLYEHELTIVETTECSTGFAIGTFKGVGDQCLDMSKLSIPDLFDNGVTGTMAPCNNTDANAWSADAQTAVAQFNTNHGACHIGATYRVEIKWNGNTYLYERYAP